MTTDWFSQLQAYGETIVIFGLFWFLCAAATAFLASTRGKDSFKWFALGLLVGPLAFVFAVRPASVTKEQHEKNATSPKS